MECFDKFVSGIDLNFYRSKYSRIKILEMDLPRNIQALDSLYECYWDEIEIGDIKDFDQYYEYYLGEKKELLEEFREKNFMCKDCFYRGLEARIYRTWASIITQIHAGYVAECVFGVSNVFQGTELDHKGIDLLIKYKDNDIKIQVKKESKRPEARIRRDISKNGDIITNIKYVVPRQEDIDNPRYLRGEKEGELKPQVMDLIEFNPDGGFLKRYDNGFISFDARIFEDIKKSYDN